MYNESLSQNLWLTALVRQAQSGDRTAFDRLADRYRPLVRALTFVRTGDMAEAEDLAQDVLLRAWRKLPSLHDPARFLPWLRAIAANACHSWFRRARPASLSDPANERLSAAGPVPLDALLARERQRELRQALVALPDTNRTALLMHVWGEYSYEEIAAATGVRVTTIEGRIYRAKKQLRRLLRDEAPRREQTQDKPIQQRRIAMQNEVPTADSQGQSQALALVLFTSQFAALIEAGISLVRTLHILKEAPPPYGEAAGELQTQVEQGETLSKAMRERPDLYPAFYVALVRAGEVGGILEETLRWAAELMTHDWRLTCRRPSGERPLLFVLPMDRTSTRDWESLTDYQRLVTRLLFCETFGLLLRAGVPILQTLEIVADLLPPAQKEKMREASEDVRLGRPLAPGRLDILPRFAVELIAMGEEHGTLDLELERAANIFERELECRLFP
ncbi:MAG: sigma-70 family RNA polymerase sigma factor [Armatimonadota bacterium]|nr:sigma-70 family RNA polymerase sigma factor [Armatimonadota bacterium]